MMIGVLVITMIGFVRVTVIVTVTIVVMDIDDCHPALLLQRR